MNTPAATIKSVKQNFLNRVLGRVKIYFDDSSFESFEVGDKLGAHCSCNLYVVASGKGFVTLRQKTGLSKKDFQIGETLWLE
jgi:hypothetical protein